MLTDEERLTVVNVVASTRVAEELDLPDIAIQLNCEYEPEQFPGVVLQLTSSCAITVTIAANIALYDEAVDCVAIRALSQIHESINEFQNLECMNSSGRERNRILLDFFRPSCARKPGWLFPCFETKRRIELI